MNVDRNAAIWFAADGYDPAKGVNGRRMVGESFIRGFFRHAQVAEFVGVTHGPTDGGLFTKLAQETRPDIPARCERLDNARTIQPVGNVFFSGPNYAPETWRREMWGQTAYSICGITHTISTKAVMEGAWHLRASPQAEWDAVICTSRAVHAALSMQMDLIDAHFTRRFGPRIAPRPQMPVIPLGIDCDDFTRDPAAGADLRARLGIGADDIVAAVVARLSPHEKFDPLPVFLALEQAQQGAGKKLHLITYGNYPDSHSRRVFEEGAARLMPSVGYHHFDHESPALRRAALSASDMFLFPIDNLQESFGLAPVEAMAAGLPVVASDWDGIKDTVTPDVGFRIPTLGSRPEHGVLTGMRYFGGTDNYMQYLSQMSAITRIDVGAMARAVRELMDNPDLRVRMGAAGIRRARQVYDWAAVVPVMQDLFANLSAIRKRARAADYPPVPATHLAVAPAPMSYFASFPTETLRPAGAERFIATGRGDLATAWAIRNYAATNRVFERLEDIETILAVLLRAGDRGATQTALAEGLKMPVLRVERCLLWLMKYDFVTGGGA